jgi:two-component system sensor histidine kinase KdpD
LKRLFHQIGGYVAGLAMVALITAFYVHEPIFKTTTIVLTYLLAILIASAIWGLGVSLCMTITATLTCDYYFFLPIGILSIDDPQDWVALISFLVTSVIGSELSARARRQAQEANRQRNEARRLYEFSQHLLSARDPVELLNEVPRQIVKVFRAQAAALYISETEVIYRSGIETPQLDSAQLKVPDARDDFEKDPEGATYVRPVCLGTQVIGTFGISGATCSPQTLESLGTMIATTVDRANWIERLGKTEAKREGERLKSVLLDAIAHDFKTPLTSIKAAATSLLDDLSFNKRQRGELLTVIDEECDRINRVIGQAIEMARLDAGEANLQVTSYPVEDLISAALDDCESVGNARIIRTEIRQPGVSVRCDFFWTRKVFGHLIRNADLYSAPGEPIDVTVDAQDGYVLFHVADSGPGIEKAEISQIFDKFYRGKTQRHRVPGTGMGLAVAKAIVEAHGGTLAAISQVGQGSVFTFRLPTEGRTKRDRDHQQESTLPNIRDVP